MALNISRNWFPKFAPLVKGEYGRAFSHHTTEHSSKQKTIDRHSGGKFEQDDMTSKVQAHEISAFVKKEWPDFPEVQCHEISARHVVVSKDVPEWHSSWWFHFRSHSVRHGRLRDVVCGVWCGWF
jgi:hypothetical protein